MEVSEPQTLERRRERPVRKKKEFTLLYVDDELPNLRGFKTTFRRFYNIFTADNPMEAMDIVKSEKIDIVVSDHRMPHLLGTDLLREVHEYDPKIGRMILSGFIKRDELKEAVESFGIHGFVTKPWDFEDLKGLFEGLLQSKDRELMEFS